MTKPINYRTNSYLRNIADSLTMLRAAAGIPLIWSLTSKHFVLAWFILLLGGISDLTDGYLARQAGGGSAWGARLDPLADKILLAAAFIWLSIEKIIPIWSIWLLFVRELLITEWRTKRVKGGPASIGGKVKTILQFISLLLILYPAEWLSTEILSIFKSIGIYIFWISLLFALTSAFQYFRDSSDTHPV